MDVGVSFFFFQILFLFFVLIHKSHWILNNFFKHNILTPYLKKMIKFISFLKEITKKKKKKIEYLLLQRDFSSKVEIIFPIKGRVT